MMNIFDYVNKKDLSTIEKIERFEYALKQVQEAPAEEVKQLLIERIQRKLEKMELSL